MHGSSPRKRKLMGPATETSHHGTMSVELEFTVAELALALETMHMLGLQRDLLHVPHAAQQP